MRGSIRILLGLCACLYPLCAAGCSNSSEPAAVVQAQVEAYNKHDLDAFVSCYAEHASIYWLDASREPTKGVEAIRKEFAFLAGIPPQYSAFGVDILNRTITGPTVADVEHRRGLPADRAPLPDVLLIYEVRNGKILNVWLAPSK